MAVVRLFLLALFLIASSTSAWAADDGYVFILGARGNPYWTPMAEAVREQAKKRGIEPTVYQVESERDAEGQLTLCQTALQRKPKILVIESDNPTVGEACYRQAAAMGAKIADIDGHFTVEQAEKLGLKLAFSVGSDNFLIGQEAAKYVAQIEAGKGPLILVLEGAVGSETGTKRVSGFKSKIQELLPSASVVASLSAEWDRLKAMSITSDMLLRYPTLGIVYAANDMMALGASEAVRNAGKTAQVKVIGIDGTIDARKAIADGRLTASVAQLPYFMGIKAVDLVIDAVKDPSKTGISVATPTPVLTKEVLDAKTEPNLRYVR